MTSDDRYLIEGIARRGDEIYERDIRAKLEGKYDGKVVAIDVNTGSYAIDEAGWSAAEAVLAKNPNAEVWLVRVGQHAYGRIGRWNGRRQ